MSPTLVPGALLPGTRLRSAVCSTEVVVVRADDPAAVLECGGQPMQPIASAGERAVGAVPRPGLDGGTVLGKRYGAAGDPVEVLCTKPGAGTLSSRGSILGERRAKALPASD
jgi:hypothetical protein